MSNISKKKEMMDSLDTVLRVCCFYRNTIEPVPVQEQEVEDLEALLERSVYIEKESDIEAADEPVNIFAEPVSIMEFNQTDVEENNAEGVSDESVSKSFEPASDVTEPILLHSVSQSSSASTLDKILDSFDVSVDESEPLFKESLSEESPYPSEDSLSLPEEPLTQVESQKTFESSPSIKSFSASSLHSISSSTTVENTHSSPLLPDATLKQASNGSYLNHPLVPLSQRNNILSCSYPLKFRPMDDDWLEVTALGEIPQEDHHQHGSRSGNYFRMASKLTGNMVSTSSTFLSEKLGWRTDGSGATPNFSLHPPRPFTKLAAVPMPKLDYTFYKQPTITGFPHAEPQLKDQLNFYQYAASASGYVGWKIVNKVMSPWTRK